MAEEASGYTLTRQNILTTKLFIPTPSTGLVSRPHLIELLNQGMNGKLILVSAPAGFGKTTLLSEWINQNSVPFCWISLDLYDNDLERFISYIIASLQTIQIQVDNQDPNLARLKLGEDFTASLIPLINQITRMDQRFCLVLDDYHQIQTPEIHDAVMFLLENLPSVMTMVIATRSDPQLRLAKLRGQGELCEVRAEDLRFSVEETRHFLNQIMGINLTLPDVTRLAKKTEGWIVGLQLAAISLQKNPDKHAFVEAFAGDDRFIADYLLDEALRSQPIHIQNFLLQSSILEQLCAPLCDAITEQKDSHEILAEIGRANLFLVPLDNQRFWYRYHHLFRDLLQHHLRQSFTPEQIANAHRSASDWYKANNMIVKAIRHAFDAGEMLGVIQLVEANVVTMLDQGEIRALIRWMEMIPSDAKNDRPWFNLAHAWTLIYAGNLKAGEDLLLRAEEQLGILEANEQVQAKGYVFVIRAYSSWLQGKSAIAEDFSRQALELLPANDLSIRAFASFTLGSSLVQSNKLDDALMALENSITLGRIAGNAHTFILATGNMAYLLLMRGQIRKAEQVCQEVFAHFDSRQTREQFPAIAQIYSMMTSVLLLRNELDQALQFAQEGLEISKRWNQIDTLTLSYSSVIDTLIARGDYKEAAALLTQVQSISKHVSRWFRLTLEESEVAIFLATGNYAAASHWVNESGLDYRDQVPETERFIYRTLAQVLMTENKFSEASVLLEGLIKDAESSGAFGLLLSLLPMQSIVQMNLGNQDKALDILSRELLMAEPEGYIRIFILLGEPMEALLRLAYKHNIQPAFCARLLEIIENDKKRRQTPKTVRQDTKSIIDMGAIDRLSGRELEVLKLIAQGCTNQEIARDLVLSLYTVKSHARNIFSKLGVKNRTEAVAKARLLGLLTAD